MDKTKNLTRQVNMLKAGFCLLALINVFLLLSAFGDRGGKKIFEEIDAQRINIVNENNIPVMVLSNNKLIPGPTINGKTYPREFADGRQNLNGIIFFNQYGDEVGGLLYNGFGKDSGYSALEHFSFDQWKQNQVVALQYLDNGKTARSGLRVYSRPKAPTLDELFDRLKIRNETPKNSPAYDSITKEIARSAARGDNGVERMFFGSIDNEPQIQLKEKKGRIRMNLFIDDKGDPHIALLDTAGTMVQRFPN